MVANGVPEFAMVTIVTCDDVFAGNKRNKNVALFDSTKHKIKYFPTRFTKIKAT